MNNLQVLVVCSLFMLPRNVVVVVESNSGVSGLINYVRTARQSQPTQRQPT